MIRAEQVTVADITSEDDIPHNTRRLRGELRLTADYYVSNLVAAEMAKSGVPAFFEDKVRFTIMSELYGDLGRVYAVLSNAIAQLGHHGPPGNSVQEALDTLGEYAAAMYPANAGGSE